MTKKEKINKKNKLETDLKKIINKSFLKLFTELKESTDPKMLIENFSLDFSKELSDILYKNFIE